MDNDGNGPLGDDQTDRLMPSRSLTSQWGQAIVQGVVWLSSATWAMSTEGARTTLARFGAHGFVLLMALAAVVLSGVNLPASDQARQPSAIAAGQSILSFSIPGNTSNTANATSTLRAVRLASNDVVARQANPITQIPDRSREAIVTYTVRAGDTLFGIALQYKLNPETVLWANPDLKDTPDLMNVGMALDIPPVDGVVHIVQEGDTVAGIAEKYKVSAGAIITAEWNSLTEGQEPVVGQHLIVPGGKRELVVWQLPVKPTAAASAAFAKAHAGFCEGASAAALGSGTFIWPTDSHTIGGNPYAYWHRAIDLPQKSGSPVYASDSGTVVYAGWNTWGYGNLLVLDHGNGWQTWYAHLSQIYVMCGQQLYQGAVIGAVGSTGRSTGPHLHFETRYNGDLPNPLNVLP